MSAVLDEWAQSGGWFDDPKVAALTLVQEWFQPTRVASYHDVRRVFRRELERWRRETESLSSSTEMIAHPSYQAIVALGRPALPHIFQELERDPDHWDAALQAITGADPVPEEHAGDVNAVADDWLAWAHRQGVRY